MKISTKLLFSCCVTLAAYLPLSSAHAASGYEVKQRWSLGDVSKWDYLNIDTVRHHLFISRADHVQVLELPSGKVLGEIANTPGVHGIAFDQDLKLGFISNGHGNSVTVFDLDTLSTKQEVKVTGVNPDAILYESASHKLYTFNGKTSNVTVIDAVSLAVVDTIKVDGKPEFAVSNGDGKIFVNIEDKSEIDVIDVATNKVLTHWALPGCEEPSGLALDLAHARLFSVCQNKTMAVTDAKTGQHVANVVIGERPDAAAYDADTGSVFSSNGEGNLDVIHQVDADHYVPAAKVMTEKGAKTMIMDHESKMIYLPAIVNKVFTVLVVGS